MNQPFRLFKNEVQRYSLFGAVFGLIFPIVATLIKILISQLPFNLSSAINVQEADPVLWIVDSAPIVLGFFAALAGRRQDTVQKLVTELSLREKSLSLAQATLEQGVKERTAELDSANKQAQARSAQLKIITELSQTIAVVRDPGELLPLIAQQISARFGFYHVGIFLLDDQKKYAILRASNSEGGKRMLARHHKLKVGGTSLVGFVSQSSYPRLALDTDEDAIFFDNPDLPETRSEVSLPLKVWEQVIGVLDVQSKQPSAFSDEDIDMFTTLANQVAIVIQNADLLEQTRSELAAYTRPGRRAWAAYPEDKTPTYAYLPDGTVARAPALKGQQLHDIIVSDQTVVLTPAPGSSTFTIAIPVKLRDQILGVIHIEPAEPNRKWSDDEIAMIQSISERTAFALENARLFEETARRAERERIVSEISTHISESTNFNRIMQTTIQELGRMLGATRAFIQLEAPSLGEDMSSAHEAAQE